MKIYTSKQLYTSNDCSSTDCFDTGPIGNCPDDGGASAGDDI